jgi:two-component system sensor histidine kinase MprB
MFSGGNRSLQDRLAMLVTLAVASAVALTGVAAYVFTYLTIYSQLDSELIEIARQTSEWISGDVDTVESLGGLNADALTTANVKVSLIRSDQPRINPPGGSSTLVLTAAEMAIARTQLGASARTGVDSQGAPCRIVSVPLTQADRHYALVLGRPLDQTSRILNTLGASLLTFGVAAVLVSALVGMAVARSGLQPIQALTRATRRVTSTDRFTPISSEGLGEFTELITSFNNMMRTLESSREQQRRLIADAGHELRTPLTSLRTNIELLIADERQHMLPEGARADILRDVAAQLGEFSTLIGDLVHLSREDSEGPQRELIDFQDVVDAALERAKRRGPNLNFDVETKPLYLVGEADSLERAVTNLLDNAIKFSPPGGTITVRLERDRLRISDQGPGIDDVDLPHVFDRFYRSDKSRATPGTGLGLSIVAQVVKAHGGWVRASRAAGGGAEFTIRLPGSPEPPPDPSAEPPADAKPARGVRARRP